MKKLYRKGTVHPSPSSPPPPPSSISDHQFSLSFLPAAVLTLAAALSAEDREVLAYLLSCSSASAAAPLDFDPSKPRQHPKKSAAAGGNNHHHPACFTCYCFTCYTSYWARWNSSPNRQLIHEIIDAFEDGLILSSGKKKQGHNKRDKRKNNNKKKSLDLNENGSDDPGRVGDELGRVESAEETGGQLGEDETGEKQGSVRKLVNLIGERIWGSVWG